MANKELPKWKQRLHEIIYEADTKEGKWFDIILIMVILLSIIMVMLESVESINLRYEKQFDIAEWIITFFFTVEYIARIICIKKPSKYIFSAYGIIDFLSTIPKYLSIFFVGTHALIALRALRLLRIFRVLKLARFLGASNNLIKALKASRIKIAVFLFSVIVLTIIFYGIIAVPTGIVTSEITRNEKVHTNTQSCPNCSYEGHDDDAIYCNHCGSKLKE